jgi:transforming growth factor-beta-induced protein
MVFLKAALLANIVLLLSLFNVAHCDTIVGIASGAENFSTLVDLVVEADLVDTLSGAGPFLVYAPTNDAFAKLPSDVVNFLLANKVQLQNVLKYHVIAGGSVVGSEESDIVADNGLIRVINTVLIPPSVLSEFEKSTQTIVDIAVNTPGFSTLADLVVQANLADTLSSDGPFTVFAPTDAAFGQLDSSVVDYLTDSRNIRALQEVLKYHVVAGKVLSSDLSNGNVNTVEGSSVEISLQGSVPMVNGVDITATDIETSNGVIHVISEVLVPSGIFATNKCPYRGIRYLPGDWAKGPTHVCMCSESGGWSSCGRLIWATCGNTCSNSSDCSGTCSVCDTRESMCVPDVMNHGNRNLRALEMM